MTWHIQSQVITQTFQLCLTQRYTHTHSQTFRPRKKLIHGSWHTHKHTDILSHPITGAQMKMNYACCPATRNKYMIHPPVSTQLGTQKHMQSGKSGWAHIYTHKHTHTPPPVHTQIHGCENKRMNLLLMLISRKHKLIIHKHVASYWAEETFDKPIFDDGLNTMSSLSTDTHTPHKAIIVFSTQFWMMSHPQSSPPPPSQPTARSSTSLLPLAFPSYPP